MADVKFEIVRTTIPTSGSTLDVTISGFGDVQAAIGMVTEAGTDDTLTADGSFAIGFLDRQGTPVEHTAFMHDEDGVGTTNCARGHYTTSFLRGSNASQTTEFNLSHNSWITDGVRLDINTNPSAARLMTVILIGGSDVSNSYVNVIGLGTGTSAIDVTAPGFEPDLVFFTGAGMSTGTTDSFGAVGLGVVHNDGSDTQGMVTLTSDPAVGTSDVTTNLRNNAVAAQVYRGAETWNASVSAFDSSGFSITPSASASNDDVSYLALKFTNNPDISIDFIDGPTATGNFSITDPGFQPNFMMFLMRDDATTFNTTTQSDGIGVYVVDENSEYTNCINSQDGVTTSYSKSLSTAKFRDLTGSGTDLHVATHSSFDATGATFNFTTVPAADRHFVVLSVGGDVAASATTGVGLLKGLKLNRRRLIG